MTGKPKVYVARNIPQIGLDLLREHAELIIHPRQLPPFEAELMRDVAGCSGILSLLSDRINGDVMDCAGPDLRVISNFAVGYDNIDVAAAKHRGIAVGNTPDVLTDATADIAVALILAAARRLGEGWSSVLKAGWKTWEPLGWLGVDLHGKTLGIVGMGRIGRAVAKRLVHGWDMKLLYSSRSSKPEVDACLGGRHVELAELMAQSDFISVHVALTKATENLIDTQALRLVKPTAVLVNTARGEVVQPEALYEALKSGRLFAAGLDVTRPEPLASDHHLLKLPNCLVLPHIGSATVTARNAMSERAARNVIAGLQGQPLPYPVVQIPKKANDPKQGTGPVL